MMERITKKEAQARADRIRFFYEELEELAAEGVLQLDSHQREKLQDHHGGVLSILARQYDIDRDRSQKQFSLGMRIASFLGALGFAASLFFLFYQFWGFFGTEVQVIILIAAPLCFLVAAAFASAREKTGYFSKILALLALAGFVLNMAMFGQIFNMAPSNTVFLLWALFAGILAYATEARLLLFFAIVSFSGFLSAQMGSWSGCYWIHFGERPENFLPAALLVFSLSQLPHHRYGGFSSLYRVCGLLLFFIPLLILSNWGRISYIDFSSGVVEAFYQVAGFCCSVLFIFLGVRKGWPEVVTCGNVFFVIFLYTKFYDWWWAWMPKYLFFLVIGLTAVLFLLIFQRLRRTLAGERVEVPL